MATYTPNFGLKRPGTAENVLVSDINNNTTAIDTIMFQNRELSGDGYDSTKTYNTDDMVIYENVMYKCLDDGVTGNWNANKWQVTNLADEVAKAKQSGGTDVEANPSGTATGTLTKLRVDNDIYSVSGGGTTVIANPSGTPTDTLETIQIGADIYEIVGSGGSAYEEVALWSGSQDASTSGNTITLDDNISNYDMINITLHHKTYPTEGGSVLLAVSGLTIGGSYIYAIYPVDGVFACFEYTSDNQLKVKSAQGSNPLTYTKVTGIKFGGSGGSNTHNYSTSEQVVGTWVDGSTLYEKTYEIDVLSPSATYTQNISIPNMNIIEIVKHYANYLYNGTWYYLSGDSLYYDNGKYLHLQYAGELQGTLALSANLGAVSEIKLCFTLRYTKTTS